MSAELPMTPERAVAYRSAAAEVLADSIVRGDQDQSTVNWVVAKLLTRSTYAVAQVAERVEVPRLGVKQTTLGGFLTELIELERIGQSPAGDITEDGRDWYQTHPLNELSPEARSQVIDYLKTKTGWQSR